MGKQISLGDSELQCLTSILVAVLERLDKSEHAHAALKINEAIELLSPDDPRLLDRLDPVAD